MELAHTAGTSSRKRVDRPTRDNASLAGSWGAATTIQRPRTSNWNWPSVASSSSIIWGSRNMRAKRSSSEVTTNRRLNASDSRSIVGIPTFSSRRVARVSGWMTRWGKAWSVSVRQQVM